MNVSLLGEALPFGLDLNVIFQSVLTAALGFFTAIATMRGDARRANNDVLGRLMERVDQLEDDKDRLSGEVADLHEDRVSDAYVRAYARILYDAWRRPPDPPEPSPIAARALGLEAE